MELLQIKMLNTAVERLLNQELAELGLTYTQTTVISFLLQNQGQDVCQRDIEFNLGLTRPTVNSILSGMERNGLVRIETREADHRFKRVLLTDAAIAQGSQICGKYRKVKERLFAGVTPEQREQMNATIQTLLKNLQEAYR